MQKNTVIISVVIALVVGAGLGYVAGINNTSYGGGRFQTQGDHVVSHDKTMDYNSGMSMVEMMVNMNAELKGKTGDEFDRAFIAQMIVHHQGAVEMAQLALTNAKHQEIKNLATDIISAQNKEIADMKMWQKTWFK